MSASQKEAVVSAVEEILGDSFVSGVTVVKDVITEDQLSELRETVATGIGSGAIAFSGDVADMRGVRRYVNGMIDNHFRKAKELNGGSKYAAKNTSGARGSRDPQLSALRKLAKSYKPGSAELTRIQGAITARENQLTQERNSAKAEQKRATTLKSIDTSVLSPELLGILNS